MRNFSSVSSNFVITYSCNDERSGNKLFPSGRSFGPDPIGAVLARLAIAFETPLDTVNSAFTAVCYNGEEHAGFISSSELSVLKSLHDFWLAYIINPTADGPDGAVFNYTNLNTGAVVSWVFVVL